MPKTLAELRASTHTALPERTLELCLSQSLVAELGALDIERSNLAVDNRDDEDGPPKRKADRPDPRLAEIDERIGELWEEMREHTGELVLRAITGGEWRRWVDAHPAREDDKFDEAVGFGYCNATDLIASLGTYAASWNGAPLDKGDWDFIESKVAPGDLKMIAQTVVQMHEAMGMKAPKLRKVSSVEETSEPA